MSCRSSILGIMFASLVLGLDLGLETAARSGVSAARGVHALESLALLRSGGRSGLVAALYDR